MTPFFSPLGGACKRLALFACTMFATSGASAHYLWLEANATTPQLFFGEIEDGERERSHGRLDEVATPHIRIVDTHGGSTACVTKRLDDHIACEAAPLSEGVGVIAEELGYPVQDWSRQGIGVVKPMFYARLLPTVDATAPAAAPVLTLDVVPTGRPQEFAVTLRGRPLANVDVRLLAPGGWMRQQRSDTQGTVRFPFPWSGFYVLHVVYLEPAIGNFSAVAYEGIRHRATLGLQQRSPEPGTGPSADPGPKPASDSQVVP